MGVCIDEQNNKSIDIRIQNWNKTVQFVRKETHHKINTKFLKNETSLVDAIILLACNIFFCPTQNVVLNMLKREKGKKT